MIIKNCVFQSIEIACSPGYVSKVGRKNVALSLLKRNQSWRDGFINSDNNPRLFSSRSS